MTTFVNVILNQINLTLTLLFYHSVPMDPRVYENDHRNFLSPLKHNYVGIFISNIFDLPAEIEGADRTDRQMLNQMVISILLNAIFLHECSKFCQKQVVVV